MHSHSLYADSIYHPIVLSCILGWCSIGVGLAAALDDSEESLNGLGYCMLTDHGSTIVIDDIVRAIIVFALKNRIF